MRKISTAINEIISNNSFLIFGLQTNLLNLSRTAMYIKPLVEARTKKDVKESAILMSLSRISRDEELAKIKNHVEDKPWVINFTVKTNLCSYAYFNTKAFRSQLAEMFPAISGQKCYFMQSQGMNEYTIIIDESQSHLVEKFIKESPKSARCGLTALTLELREDWYDTVGVISGILQKIAFQGISVHEVSTTFSELIFCVDQKDLKMTVETLCSIGEMRGLV